MKPLTLSLTAFGDHAGVILPNDVLEKLGAKCGDSLYVTETAHGIALTGYREVVSMQVDLAAEVMHENRDVLIGLAK